MTHRHTDDVGSQHASSASVALDIGAGRGALVIYPAERYRDREIEISRVDGDGRRVHTGRARARDARGLDADRDLRQPRRPASYVVWADATGRGRPRTSRLAGRPEAGGRPSSSSTVSR